jgi:hypothetical protein
MSNHRNMVVNSLRLACLVGIAGLTACQTAGVGADQRSFAAAQTVGNTPASDAVIDIGKDGAYARAEYPTPTLMAQADTRP